MSETEDVDATREQRAKRAKCVREHPCQYVRKNMEATSSETLFDEQERREMEDASYDHEYRLKAVMWELKEIFARAERKRRLQTDYHGDFKGKTPETRALEQQIRDLEDGFAERDYERTIDNAKLARDFLAYYEKRRAKEVAAARIAKRMRESGFIENKGELTWNNWNAEFCCAVPNALSSEEVSGIIGDLAMEKTKMLVVKAQKTIKHGINAFVSNAHWSKPETDIKIIAERLGKSEKVLHSYNKYPFCWHRRESYEFSKTDIRCFTIHGFSTNIQLKCSEPHVCLCALLDDGLFVFDLFKDEPFLMYGVPVSREFMDETKGLCDHLDLYAISTMSFLNKQMEEQKMNNQSSLKEVLDVLWERKRVIADDDDD